MRQQEPQQERKGFTKVQITDVRIRQVAKEGKMKAVVSITLDNEFVVHDIKVIDGDKGLFIAMPSRKTLDGEFRDIAHPINSETRDMLQQIILEKYEQSLEEENTQASYSKKQYKEGEKRHIYMMCLFYRR